MLVFNIVAMFGFLVVILIPAWQAVLVGSVFSCHGLQFPYLQP